MNPTWTPVHAPRAAERRRPTSDQGGALDRGRAHHPPALTKDPSGVKKSRDLPTRSWRAGAAARLRLAPNTAVDHYGTIPCVKVTEGTASRGGSRCRCFAGSENSIIFSPDPNRPPDGM